MKLYVFNPDHDEAIAHPEVGYNPSKAAKSMMRDLACLPLWYARPHSLIWAPETRARVRWQEGLSGLLPPMDWLDLEPDNRCLDQVEPWGWDEAVKRRLTGRAIRLNLMPDSSQLERVRLVSSRRTAVNVLSLLRKEASQVGWNDWLCGRSWWVNDSLRAQHLIETEPRGLIKAAWSGSGRGLYRTYGQFEGPVTQWCRKLLERQNGFSFEPFYEKKLDFALEFYADGHMGKVRYEGLSVFYTTERGAYAGNRVASQEGLVQVLEENIPGFPFDKLRRLCQDVLTRVTQGKYTGYLGVDMMVCQTPGGPRVHPCVEINFRRTMGYVALRLARFLAIGSEGKLCFDFDRNPDLLFRRMREQQNRSPLIRLGGRIEHGYLPLTPIDGQTHFHASLQVIKYNEKWNKTIELIKI